METPNLPAIRALLPAWHKGRIVSQKRPLSTRRRKVTQIYKKTGNLRAVQPLLLGHTKIDSTVRCLGVELEDALATAEAIEI